MINNEKTISQSNNKSKKMLITLVAIFVSLLALISSVTTAWIVSSKKTDPLKFTVAHVDSIIYLYKGSDFDRDGNLDLGSVQNRFGGYDIFEMLPKKVIDGKEQEYIELTNAYPTQIFTVAIDVFNNGNREGEVVISLKDFTYQSNPNALKLLSFSLKEYGTEEFGDKVYYSSITEENILPIIGTEGIVSNDGVFVDVNDSRTFLLRVEVETYENLIRAGINMTESEYLSAQSSLITLPSLSIILQTRASV